MKKTLFIVSLLMAFLACGESFAQQTQQKDYITITFTPNHQNWVYALGETVEMEISVRQFNYDLRNVDLNITWGMERSNPDEEKTINTGKNGVVKMKFKGSKVPGFKTLNASYDFEGRTYKNYITVAFEPDKIQPTTTLPNDFMDFWNKNLEYARKTPLKPVFTLQPDLCSSVSDVYMVRFQNEMTEHYIYGMMKVPKGLDIYHEGAKKYPALLEVPGAGVRGYKGMADDYTEAGIITLQVGIHGIPVNLPEQVYNDLKRVALSSYNAYQLDNRDTYYYKHVYTGMIRAVDLLCSMPVVDATRIGVTGGSQGGALTIVVAGLDSRITCAAPAYPALCELAGSQYGRIDGWPRMFTGNSNSVARDKKIENSRYYDVVNFARFVKVPTLFFQGFNDTTCPPTTTFAAYNIMTCDKQLVLDLDCAHWIYGQFWQKKKNWLIEQLTK